MHSRFGMASQKVNGELHISLRGCFDGSSAWGLIDLLKKKYQGERRILIDTGSLRETCPFGCSTLECHLRQAGLPLERLFFKGEKASEIAPKGTRVIPAPKKPLHACSGKCANCRCSGKGGQN